MHLSVLCRSFKSTPILKLLSIFIYLLLFCLQVSIYTIFASKLSHQVSKAILAPSSFSPFNNNIELFRHREILFLSSQVKLAKSSDTKCDSKWEHPATQSIKSDTVSRCDGCECDALFKHWWSSLSCCTHSFFTLRFTRNTARCFLHSLSFDLQSSVVGCCLECQLPSLVSQQWCVKLNIWAAQNERGKEEAVGCLFTLSLRTRGTLSHSNSKDFSPLFWSFFSPLLSTRTDEKSCAAFCFIQCE